MLRRPPAMVNRELPDNALFLNYDGKVVMLRITSIVMRESHGDMKTYEIECLRTPADEREEEAFPILEKSFLRPPELPPPGSYVADIVKTFGVATDRTKGKTFAGIDFAGSVIEPYELAALTVLEQEKENRHEDRIRQL